MRSASDSRPSAVGEEGERKRKFRGFELYLLLVLLVAVFVAGGALARLYGDRPPAEGSAEAGFARDMSEHHAQAVRMAEIVLRRTNNAEIRVLATDILLSQQNQIGQMQGWLAAWRLPLTGSEPAMSWMGHPTKGLMPGMARPDQISALETLPPDEADKQFLKLMIPHHQAAIPMAKAVLAKTDRPEVERLARAIAASQEAEIQTMRAMLQKMSETPPKEAPMTMQHAGRGG